MANGLVKRVNYKFQYYLGILGLDQLEKIWKL